MFSPKDMSLVGQHQLSNLTHILMIASKDSLLGLKMKNAASAASNDIFLESVRRTELVVFLLSNAENQKWSAPKISQSSKVNLSVKSNDKKGQLVNFNTDRIKV